MNTTTTTTHSLTFDVPSTRDYLNGGFGDLVAQCSCGAHEYVYSRTEGAYWHALHVERPTAHPSFLLVNQPMPEGWTEPAPAPVQVVLPAAPAARVYTCLTCRGLGDVEASGAWGGRVYQFGDRAECPECSGAGTSLVWRAA